MKKTSTSEKLLLTEIAAAARKLKLVSQGYSVGELMGMIRNQLGMSQSILAELAVVPQSTVSRIEKSKRPPNLATLEKILSALSCELVIVPLLTESTEAMRRKQAHRVAENNVRYQQSSMNLEEADKKFIKEMIKEVEEEVLRAPGSKLWKMETKDE